MELPLYFFRARKFIEFEFKVDSRLVCILPAPVAHTVGLTIFVDFPCNACLWLIKLSSEPESISTCNGVDFSLIFLAFLAVFATTVAIVVLDKTNLDNLL